MLPEFGATACFDSQEDPNKQFNWAAGGTVVRALALYLCTSVGSGSILGLACAKELF